MCCSDESLELFCTVRGVHINEMFTLYALQTTVQPSGNKATVGNAYYIEIGLVPFALCFTFIAFGS